MIRRFITNIVNIVRWIPVLWNNRDWDYCYLLNIMEHKLDSMSSHFKKHNVFVGSEKAVKQMRICAELCKRISADDYDFGPFWFNDKRIDELEKVYEHFLESGEFVGTVKNTWVSYRSKQRQQDMELLGKLMTKHVLGWWN